MRKKIRSAVLVFSALMFASPVFAGEASEKAAARLLDQTLKNQSPADLAILRAVKGKDIVVVRGSMDHIEHVLSAARIRHTVINPNQIAQAELRGGQILMINCPGNIPKSGLKRIERFVRAGGLLYTTDWALLNVIQKIFPGTIKHNGASTGDHVTQVHVHGQGDNMMTNMLLTRKSRPQWWLEGGSYPIKIINRNKVKVLASSREMKKAYGSSPVVVRFRWDDGEVIHVVSHFYRQAAARGPAVATKDAVDKLDLTPKQKAELQKSPEANTNFADVESSYAFQRMTSNLIVGKKKKNVDLRKVYKWRSKKPVKVGGKTLGEEDRMKIISREGDEVRVRDERGYETTMPVADLY